MNKLPDFCNEGAPSDLRDPYPKTMLDLFCGLKGASAPFTPPEWGVVTVDIEEKFEPTIVRDLSKPEVYEELYNHNPNYDFVWASPPCTHFSIAGVRFHWTPEGPSDETKEQIKMVEHLVEFCKRYPYFVIENPRGMMRKLDIMKDLNRMTITQCQYGNSFMKPTDLWGRFPPNWAPKPMCKRGAPCHTPAPRGTSGGVQSQKKGPIRSLTPYELADSFRKCYD